MKKPSLRKIVSTASMISSISVIILAAKGGITVEAEVRNGTLIYVTVLKNGIDVTDEYTITL